jgi:hypothetical protein
MDLVSATTVGLTLKINPTWVRRKARNGELPCIRLGKGPKAPMRFDLEEVLKALHAYKADDTEIQATCGTASHGGGG